MSTSSPSSFWGRILAPLRALTDWIELDLAAGRAFIFLLFISATALLLPRITDTTYRYTVGQPWAEPDLVAPFDFPIKKPADELERNLKAARKLVPWVFLATEAQPQRALAELGRYQQALDSALLRYRALSPKGQDTLELFWRQLEPRLAPLPSPETWQELERQGTGPLATALRNTLDALYSRPYIDRRVSELPVPFLSLRQQKGLERLADAAAVVGPSAAGEVVELGAAPLTPAVAQLYRQLMAQWATPNYRFDPELYQADVQLAEQEVSPYRGLVAAGTVVVARGQRVTVEIGLVLASLNEELAGQSGNASSGIMFLGQLLVVALLTFLTAQFLRKDRRIIYRNNRKTALVFFIIFLMVVFGSLTLLLAGNLTPTVSVNLFYLVPLSMAAIMATVFFDDRVGYFVNILVSVLAGFVVHTNFELFFVQLCAGSVAIFNITILRKRSQFFITAGSLLLTYAVAYLGYNLYLHGNFTTINYWNLPLFVLNVVITLATYPLIYIVERLFGLTSDLTYIELLDTDHPLLKDLAIKAPGTYQHSLQVANIAEAVATKIGANALQVRVGGLFHDVGKMFQPEYFIENQSGDNPHGKLDAKVSAEVIINHVAYGEELARDHNLPKEVIDFIRTHHGTSRVEYFYRTYQRQNPECDENDFRYKGPLPTSKEMAILMLADACEAASRAMKRPTAEDLKVMVDTIVSGKINDNQLVLARITFRDVYTIKAEILKILQNIYHTRIAYPERSPAPAEVVEPVG